MRHFKTLQRVQFVLVKMNDNFHLHIYQHNMPIYQIIFFSAGELYEILLSYYCDAIGYWFSYPK